MTGPPASRDAAALGENAKVEAPVPDPARAPVVAPPVPGAAARAATAVLAVPPAGVRVRAMDVQRAASGR